MSDTLTDIPPGPIYGNGIGNNRLFSPPVGYVSVPITTTDTLYFGKKQKNGKMKPSAGLINRLMLCSFKMTCYPEYTIIGCCRRGHRAEDETEYLEPEALYDFVLTHNDMLSLFQRNPEATMQTLTLREVLEWVIFSEALRLRT